MNVRGIGARLDDEFLLNALTVREDSEINSWPHFVIHSFQEGRYSGMPFSGVGAREVTMRRRDPLLPLD
jgi:hypothetical protein